MSDTAVDNVPGTMMEVPIESVRPSPIKLREAQLEDPDFLSLKESIAKHGILSNILARKAVDPADNKEYFQLIDGLQRFTIATQLKLATLPIKVTTATEAEVLVLQVQANVQKVKTKPAQLYEQFERYMVFFPDITQSELAEKFSLSQPYVSQILKLKDINPKLKKIIDEGKLPLNKAVQLARIKNHDEQMELLEEAVTNNVATLTGTIDERIKAERKAKLGQPKPEGFVPVASMRSLKEVKAEYESYITGQGSKVVEHVIASSGASTVTDGFIAGVEWVINLDKDTVAQKKAEYEAKKKREEEKKRLDKEKKEAEKAEKARQVIEQAKNS